MLRLKVEGLDSFSFFLVFFSFSLFLAFFLAFAFFFFRFFLLVMWMSVVRGSREGRCGAVWRAGDGNESRGVTALRHLVALGTWRPQRHRRHLRWHQSMEQGERMRKYEEHLNMSS